MRPRFSYSPRETTMPKEPEDIQMEEHVVKTETAPLSPESQTETASSITSGSSEQPQIPETEEETGQVHDETVKYEPFSTTEKDLAGEGEVQLDSTEELKEDIQEELVESVLVEVETSAQTEGDNITCESVDNGTKETVETNKLSEEGEELIEDKLDTKGEVELEIREREREEASSESRVIQDIIDEKASPSEFMKDSGIADTDDSREEEARTDETEEECARKTEDEPQTIQTSVKTVISPSGSYDEMAKTSVEEKLKSPSSEIIEIQDQSEETILEIAANETMSIVTSLRVDEGITIDMHDDLKKPAAKRDEPETKKEDQMWQTRVEEKVKSPSSEAEERRSNETESAKIEQTLEEEKDQGACTTEKETDQQEESPEKKSETPAELQEKDSDKDLQSLANVDDETAEKDVHLPNEKADSEAHDSERDIDTTTIYTDENVWPPSDEGDRKTELIIKEDIHLDKPIAESPVEEDNTNIQSSEKGDEQLAESSETGDETVGPPSDEGDRKTELIIKEDIHLDKPIAESPVEEDDINIQSSEKGDEQLAESLETGDENGGPPSDEGDRKTELIIKEDIHLDKPIAKSPVEEDNTNIKSSEKGDEQLAESLETVDEHATHTPAKNVDPNQSSTEIIKDTESEKADDQKIESPSKQDAENAQGLDKENDNKADSLSMELDGVIDTSASKYNKGESTTIDHSTSGANKDITKEHDLEETKPSKSKSEIGDSKDREHGAVPTESDDDRNTSAKDQSDVICSHPDEDLQDYQNVSEATGSKNDDSSETQEKGQQEATTPTETEDTHMSLLDDKQNKDTESSTGASISAGDQTSIEQHDDNALDGNNENEQKDTAENVESKNDGANETLTRSISPDDISDSQLRKKTSDDTNDSSQKSAEAKVDEIRGEADSSDAHIILQNGDQETDTSAPEETQAKIEPAVNGFQEQSGDDIISDTTDAQVDSQVSMKMMRGEVSAKTTYQRTSTGPIAISEVSPEGKFIVLENTSSGPNRRDVNLDGWKVKRSVDGKHEYIYPFRNFTLKAGKKVKILARGSASEAGLNDLVFRDEDTWGVGSQVTTMLINEKDEICDTNVENRESESRAEDVVQLKDPSE